MRLRRCKGTTTSWLRDREIPSILRLDFVYGRSVFYFTAFLRSLPALNFGAFLAAIFISLPVCGFLPFLAFLCVTENVPKPTRITLSPFFRAFFTPSTNESIALPAAALVTFASFAILSINSVFVIHLLLKRLYLARFYERAIF